jgi:acyl dehydratase
MSEDAPRPVSGRWFEDLTVGEVIHHATRRTVTETDNVLFTTMTRTRTDAPRRGLRLP